MENDVQKTPVTSKRKKLLPLLLVVALLVVGGIVAGVTLLSGPTRKTEVEIGDFETLKEVVEATETERVITLTADILMTESITVPENVKIIIKDDGTSRTLTRQDMDTWMFWVSEDSTLELQGTKAQGLVLDGNSSSVKCGPDGALLIGEYAEFVLDNVVLKDNRTNSGMGGLMRVVTCNVTATNSSFTGGTSKSGGAVYAVESNLSFTNCDISENRSTQGHGGALYVDNAGTLSLLGCTLNENYINTGSGYGGAFIITNFSTADIVDTTFDGNYADHDGSACGGAMYIAWGSSANFSGKTVVSNSYAKGGGESNALGGAVYINEGSSMNVGEGVLFSGNSSTHGGAIYAIDTAVVNVDGAIFTDNHTTKGNGGAIYCWRGPKLNAKNTTFLKNYTKSEVNAYGGAVAIATGGASANIESCVFEGNYTDNVGFCNGGALLVGTTSKVTMSGNNVFKDNWGKSTGGKNTCGGAIYVSDATLEMSAGTTFTGNYGTHGGAVYMNANGKFIVDGAKFENNYSYLGHGGAVCAWNGGSMTATNCSFVNNTINSTTGGYGGAVAIYNADDQKNTSTATFTGCTFDGNYINRSGNIHTNGGAMYIGMGADVTVNGGSVFTNNYAKVNNDEANCYGGAIYLNTDSVLNLGASSFANNRAEVGGAVMAYGSAKVNVNGATFTGNYTTVEHGGAVYTIKTPTTISGSTFNKNYAEKHGGAVMIVGVEEGTNVSSGSITNCSFNGNYSKTQRGGAVASFYATKLAISGSSFTENYTNYAHGGAVFTQNMPVEIKTSTFTKNRVESEAGGYGGAVAIVNTEVAVAKSSGVITDCVFDGNYAVRTAGDNAACGGAVYAGLGTKLTINGTSEFKNNYVKAFNVAKAYNGGAVYGNDYTEITVADTVTFTNNTSRLGGAICTIGAAKLDVTGAKFDANSTNYGHGGAIYAENTAVALKASSFTNNKVESTATGYGGAVAIANKTATDGKSNGTIVDCVFEGNSVVRPSGTSAANGGALYIGLGSKVDISGKTEFKNNVAQAASTAQQYYGGAIYANTDCEVTIGEGAVFTGNTGRMGGAIGVVGAAKLDVTGATFDGNYTNYAHGGAIYSDTTDVALKNSTFTNNKVDSAAAGYGGAVAIDSKAAATSKTLTIDSCVFDGNSTVRPESGTANANGGALYVGLYSKADITGNTVFKNNKAAGGAGKGNGGAIYLNTGCTVNVGEAVKFENNEAKANGGAIGAAGAAAADWKININGATFTGNKASSDAAVYNDAYGVVTINGATVTPAEGATTNDFVIPAGETLNVSGKVALGTVKYAAETSVIKVTGAVEGSAMLIPAKYEEGVQIVKADDAALLAGIGDKFSVAKDGTTPWDLDDAGKLKNVAPTVKIGDAEYVTLDLALAAAKSGDELVLLADTKVTADTEIPADVTVKSEGGYTITVASGIKLTVNGAGLKGATIIGDVIVKDGADLSKATITGNVTAGANVVLAEAVITGNVTAGENAKLNGAKITGDVNVGAADATDAAISGTVTVAEGKALTVGGAFTAAEVYLNEDATVNVATALTAADKAFVLKSAVEIANTVLVTAPDAAAVEGAVAKINGSFTAKVALGTNGLLIPDTQIAKITRGGVNYIYESIADAAAAAQDGDTITLIMNNASYTVNKQIVIRKNVTIDGAGKTLLRGEQMTTAMINVTDKKNADDYLDAIASLTLKNITLDGDGENVTGTEALVYNRGLLTINSDVTITNVKSSGIGGAIYTDARHFAEAKLVVDGATITGNETTTSGAAIYVKSGAAEITGATITDNKAAIHAGAIYVYTGTLTVDGATITGNEAGGNGGAILLVNDSTNASFVQPTATINDTVISNNKTTNSYDDPSTDDNEAGATTFGRGGAIYAGTQGDVTLTNVTAKGNSARQGGVMYTFSKNLTMTGGTYGGTADGEANSVTDAGAVFMTGDTTATISIDGGTYTGNTANNGAVFYIRAKDTATINGGTFTGNSAKNGGVVYNAGTLTIANGTYNANKASGHGGVAYTENNLTITNGSFTGNEGTSATSCGGVVYHIKAGTVTINGGTFTNNKALSAGGVYFNANGSNGKVKLVVDGGTYTGNQTKDASNGNGGAVYNHSQNTAEISNATFTGGIAKNGGAFFCNANGEMTLTNVTVSNCKATLGGVVYMAGKVTINGGTYGGDTADTDKNYASDAGGVVCNAAGGVLTINNNAMIKNNVAKTRGGVVYNAAGSKTTVNSGTFDGNKTETNENATDSTYGGGVFAMKGDSGKTNQVIINGGTFKNNQSAKNGGVFMAFNGPTTITINGEADAKVIFEGNKAVGTKSYGGVYYSKSTTACNFSATYARFVSNEAQYGGAIASATTTAGTEETVFNNCEFVNNKATTSSGNSHGGAIIARGGVVKINDCVFEGNQSVSGSGTGGAIRLDSNNANVTINAGTVFSTENPNLVKGVRNDIKRAGGTLTNNATGAVVN